MSHCINAKMLGILGVILLVVLGASCGRSIDVDKSVSSTYKISGYVFTDSNLDGVFNTADHPEAGIKVQLLDVEREPDAVLYEAVTDAFGCYTMIVARGTIGVLKVPDDIGDDYIPPFCNISGDPSGDLMISFHK